MSNPVPPPRPGRPLSRMVAYSWSRQWPAEILMGLSGGIVGLAPFALQRSLGAPTWTSPLLIVLGQALWILAPAWPLLLARMKRQATFTWIGLFSRGPLLLIGLASVTPVLGGKPGQGMGDWSLLFATYLLSVNLDAVYTPHRNALIRANYPLTARGRIYGLVTLVTGVASMASSQAVGHVLDHDPTIVRLVFPLAAIVGIVGHVLMSRVRWRYESPAAAPDAGGGGAHVVRDAMASAARATKRTLREDRSFRDYEIGFMLYGLGLLSATPLIVTRFAQSAAFSPSDWANADRLALPATQLLLVWVVGRMSDRLGVVYVAALSFLGLVPYYVWMSFVGTPHELLLSALLMGVCMSGVNVSWALGPLHFAPRGQAHHYSSVHVACVGVRSVLGPAIGWAVQNLFNYQAAMIVSASLEALAGLWMLRLARKVHSTS